VTILAVAEDVQGAQPARPWVEQAKVQYRVVVDRENLLGTLYHFKVVPIGIVLDEEGRIVREVSPIDINDGNTRGDVERWVTQNILPASWSGAEQRSPQSIQKTPVETEAEALFRAGMTLLKEGRRDEAIAEFRKAFRRDPGNWIIRKQVWAIEHPERFYTGPVDYEWQKKQIEREDTELGR
jgi:tetratricopeptide (TPR) repeat protein